MFSSEPPHLLSHETLQSTTEHLQADSKLHSAAIRLHRQHWGSSRKACYETGTGCTAGGGSTSSTPPKPAV